MLPPAADARVQRELERLLGLELSGTHRGADLRVLKFGPLRPAGRGTVGDLALHVQCPWRIDGSDGVVTGRGDLWEPVAGWKGLDMDSYDYDEVPNLQDRRMAEWLGDLGPDGPPREIVARRGEGLVVKAVRATAACGAEIDLSGGYRLTLFPAGSTGEDWRLLNPTDEDAPHFVVGGGRVEEDG